MIRLPYHFAKKHGVVASATETDTVQVYHLAETPLSIFMEIKRVIQHELEFIEVDTASFQKHLATIYQANDDSVRDAAETMDQDGDLLGIAENLPAIEDLLDTQDHAPIIQLINALLTQAINQKASDIHIETYENRVLVRHRMDGLLQEVLELPRHVAPLVISRIKVMAKLDIAEKRIPQDGRMALRIGKHSIDVRVSTLPANHGERIVMRILDQAAAQLNLSLLGMSHTNLSTISHMIAQPHGIILVTGPTGSGKTTSLYAMLSELNQVSRNILTIEDPIEYDLPGIGQTQINQKANMNFASGLRAILRQDPDVVMVGEIRDVETAEIAVQASLTGHLVLSTLHTNSALGALTRLSDMGVERFLLSASMVGMIAQRLVRKLCQHCKLAQQITQQQAADLGFCCSSDVVSVYTPQGCKDCQQSGYRGRTGIYEIIPMDDTLRDMIHHNENMHAMEQHARTVSISMRQDGWLRVLMGDTSIAEIIRVTCSETFQATHSEKTSLKDG